MSFIKFIFNITLIISSIVNTSNDIELKKEIEASRVSFNVEEVTELKEEKDEIEINSEERTEEINLKEENTLYTYTGTITSYTAYCDGCIGITASGYNVLNTMYYYDDTYGSLRIIAMDNSIPFGSVVKLSNIIGYEDIYAIVLDRGGAISFNGQSQVDLLFDDYTSAINFGRKENSNIEILRYGY